MTRRLFVAAGALSAARPDFVNVRAHGAAGDGSRLDTAAIQAAIDSCAKAGGGAVFFPPGVYRSGTIQLRSRVTLHLGEGSRLAGSTDLKDYPPRVAAFRSYTDNYTDKSLIYAESVESVAIEGRGVIDGRGASFQGPYKVRPYLMRFVSCRDVDVRDVMIENSPMWVQHYLACDGVRLNGLTVRSRVNHNNDGIDIDCCDRVRISDCDISSGDDAIVLKSTSNRPCRDVVISNCVLSSACNALKLGTESNGGFENIAVSNCTLYDTRLSGIALEIVDGGTLRHVNISNITMRNVAGPVFIRLGDRGRPYEAGDARPGVGKLGGILLQGIQASGGSRIGCAIAGLPEHPVEDITLRDVSIAMAGGGTREDAAREVPENAEKYPEFSMFGVLPAYGLWCRHARNVRFDNVRCTADAPDARPPLVCEDVDGLDITAFRGNGAPVFRRVTRL